MRILGLRERLLRCGLLDLRGILLFLILRSLCSLRAYGLGSASTKPLGLALTKEKRLRASSKDSRTHLNKPTRGNQTGKRILTLSEHLGQ